MAGHIHWYKHTKRYSDQIFLNNEESELTDQTSNEIIVDDNHRNII
jgi:hypothetical protein